MVQSPPHSPPTFPPRILADTNARMIGHLVILAIKASGCALAPLRHRFLWHICKYLGKTVEKYKFYCTMRIGADSLFRFYLHDPYWSMLLSKTFSYEEELAIVLARTKDLDFAFVDCGANFGYWSVLASSTEANAHKVVSIEASPETYEALAGNWDLNSRRFEIVGAGVSSETGTEVEVSRGRGHAGAHIGASRQGERKIGTVSTITIDDVLLNAFGGKIPPRILLKLDVEGAEISALQGARMTLMQDCLICYEDHGRDRESATSNYMLHTLRWPVFFVHPNDGLISVMHSLADVNRIKMLKIRGTNFFACRPDSAFLPALDGPTGGLLGYFERCTVTNPTR